MTLQPQTSIADHFADIEDPRIERTKDHLLIDILTIAILAVICEADGWVAIETYGHAKYDWLNTFLDLPNGIPSHDTFGRVFARLDPDQLQSCFLSWVRSVSQVTDGEVIAIDGKTARRSYDQSNGKGAIHMVSAWASQNRLVLGQRNVDERSNEITAIPELLRVLYQIPIGNPKIKQSVTVRFNVVLDFVFGACLYGFGIRPAGLHRDH